MNLSTAELAALASGSYRLGIFFLLYSDPITRLWLGIGDCEPGVNALDVSGERYFGAGELVNVPALRQLANGTAEEATFSLSGVTQAIVDIATAHSPVIQGAKCYVGYGIQDSAWALLGPVKWTWLTFADYLSIDQQRQSDPAQPIIRTVSLAVSSAFSIRSMAKNSYFTNQDQVARSATDKFCDRVQLYSRLASKVWPRF